MRLGRGTSFKPSRPLVGSQWHIYLEAPRTVASASVATASAVAVPHLTPFRGDATAAAYTASSEVRPDVLSPIATGVACPGTIATSTTSGRSAGAATAFDAMAVASADRALVWISGEEVLWASGESTDWVS